MCLAVARDFIATGGADGSIRLWSTRTHQCMSQYSPHRGAVRAVRIDVTNPCVLHSCGDDRTVVSYDLRSERRLAQHSLRDGALTDLVQRRDGELELLTTVSHGHVLMWDSEAPQPVGGVVDPGRARLSCLSLSPDGRFVAVGGVDAQVKVYAIDGFRIVAACLGHSAAVAAVQWSVDQRQIISVGEDAAICVWNFYA